MPRGRQIRRRGISRHARRRARSRLVPHVYMQTKIQLGARRMKAGKLVLLAVLMMCRAITATAQCGGPTATNFTVYLSGANEVPPNSSGATASATFTLDGNTLGGALWFSIFSYRVTA